MNDTKDPKDYGFKENQDGKLEPVPGALKTEEEMLLPGANEQVTIDQLRRLEEKRRMALREVNQRIQTINADIKMLGKIAEEASALTSQVQRIRKSIGSLERFYEKRDALIGELEQTHSALLKIGERTGDDILIHETKKKINRLQTIIRTIQ